MVKAVIVKDEHGIVGEEADVDFEAGDARRHALLDGREGIGNMAARKGGAMAAEGAPPPEDDRCERGAVFGIHDG
ncbi:MAG: hypothetical protein AMXMBFR80_23570 [Dehalococcoidia bacterium]